MDTSRHILNTVTIKDSLFGLTVAVSRNEWAATMEFPIEESFLTTENIRFLLHDDATESLMSARRNGKKRGRMILEESKRMTA